MFAAEASNSNLTCIYIKYRLKYTQLFIKPLEHVGIDVSVLLKEGELGEMTSSRVY